MRTISIITTTLLALAGAANAQRQQPADKPADKIEPQAMAALDRMGAYLRQQQSFTVHETTETDYVLDSGQKVTLGARGDLRVRRPDRLRADVTSDRKQREFFYDGKTFTMASPRMGYYAQVPAPPTLVQLADQLQDRYAIQLPLVDLFRWGTNRSSRDQITSATYVGKTRLGAVEVDHYAFRQPGLDWQVWIERGDKPLPRKIVLTTTDDPARPQVEVDLSWELGARHPDAEFAFTPTKDSRRIKIAEVGAVPAEEARSARRRVRR